MNQLKLDDYEKPAFVKKLADNLDIYAAEKKDGTDSVRVLADRILDDLNNLLKARDQQGADTPRRKYKDRGDVRGKGGRGFVLVLKPSHKQDKRKCPCEAEKTKMGPDVQKN